MRTIKPDASRPRVSAVAPRFLPLLAVSAGLGVANNYYNQALLGHLSLEFRLSAASVSAIPVATQLGNVVGILLLAPLGDRLERRSLILATSAALTLALVGMAVAPTMGWLVIATASIGLFATVTLQIVAFAMHLAAPRERGHVLGVVTSGILIGILSARTVSGVIADVWGWRSVFWTAAGLMFLTATALGATLPRAAALTDSKYAQLIYSLWPLWRTHRVLRQAVVVQALLFAAFSAFWSELALLFAAEPYRLGSSAVGAMAFAGILGSLAAPLAGRSADRQGPERIVLRGAWLVMLAFAMFGLIQGSLVALIGGVLLMDLGVQSSQVANQARVHTLDPNAQSRLNTIFMAIMILGGAFGAGAGGVAYFVAGWSGTCMLGSALALLAIILHARHARA